MRPLWLRRALALLPPMPARIGPLVLSEYLPEFGGLDDGPRVTWKPDPSSPGAQLNERSL